MQVRVSKGADYRYILRQRFAAYYTKQWQETDVQMVGTSRPVYHNRFIIPRSTIATETRQHPSPSNHIVCPTRLADERGYSAVILLALEETRQVRRCSAARRHEILSQTRDIRRTPTIIDIDIVDRHRDTPTPPVSVFSASPRARAKTATKIELGRRAVRS